MAWDTIRDRVRRELKDEKSYQVEDCEDAWVAKSNVTCTADATYYKEGTKSAKMAIADGFTTGIAASEDITEVDLSSYDKVVLWVRPSITTIVAGDLEIVFCKASGGAGIIENLDIPAMATADQWYRFAIDFTDRTLYTNVVGVALNVVTDRGACDVYLDDVCVEPATYRWTDTALETHIERAVRELSRELPRKRVTVLKAAKTCHNPDDDNDIDEDDPPDGITEVDTRLNAIKAAANTHFADATYHKAADTTNSIDASDASNLATAKTLEIEIRLDINAHRVLSGAHYVDDEINQLSYDNPADTDDLEVAVVTIEAAFNNHLTEEGTGCDLDISSLTSRIRVTAVEWPTGKNPPRYEDFEIFGDILTLLVSTGPADNDEDIKVYWDAFHTEASLEDYQEDLACTGTQGIALLEYASYTTNKANIGDVSLFRVLGEEKLIEFRSLLQWYKRQERHKAIKASIWDYNV